MWLYESPGVISLWKFHNLKVLKFGKVKILIILLFKKKHFYIKFFQAKISKVFFIFKNVFIKL